MYPGLAKLVVQLYAISSRNSTMMNKSRPVSLEWSKEDTAKLLPLKRDNSSFLCAQAK